MYLFVGQYLKEMLEVWKLLEGILGCHVISVLMGSNLICEKKKKMC